MEQETDRQAAGPRRTGHDGSPPACDGCGSCDTRGGSRREFLAQSALALALLGATRLPLLAATPPAVRGRWRSDGAVTYAVPAADGASIDRGNQVILVRWEGWAYAFWLSCPHRRTALRWEEDDARFQCPKHHSKYEPDGRFVSGRATRGMDRYPIRLEQGQLVVDTSVLYQNDEDPAGWAAAAVELGQTDERSQTLEPGGGS